MRRKSPLLGLAAAFLMVVSDANADSLRGSRASLLRQTRAAAQNDFTLLDRAEDVRRYVELGLLVPIGGNRDYALHRVSFPVGRPALKTFVERLAAQYRRACGERLVVTSLTRPKSRQPSNAYRHSVHRTGMAVDLRRSERSSCRAWLERTLRSLEKKGVIEATAERRPAHYHVAIFPKRYAGHVDAVDDESAATDERYRIRRGDSLWTIAREHGTTVERLRDVNSLDGSAIDVGQTLRIPGDV